MPDPLIPMSDRPRWETDPAPAELAELMALALDVEGYDSDDGHRRRVLDCVAALRHVTLPENRAALVGWLIAEGIAVPSGLDQVTDSEPPAYLPLFLLDGAP